MGLYKASLYNFVFNSINNVLIIVYGILLIPLYLKFITLSTYGAWLASGNVVAMLSLVESGFSSVITQRMSVSIAQNDTTSFLKQAGANILSSFIFSAIIFSFSLIVSFYIADWTQVEGQDALSITWAFRLSALGGSIGVINSLLGAFPQVWQETKKVGQFSTVTSIIGIAVTIFSLYSGFGIISLAIGILARALFQFCYITSIVISTWRKKDLPLPIFSKDTLTELLQSCLYPFFSKLTNVLMSNSQNFIIAAFISPSATAIYDLTYKICYSAANFVQVTNGSFFALLSLSYSSGDSISFNKIISKVSLFFLLMLITIVVYSFCFTEIFVSYWVGVEKFGGYLLLALLVLYTLSNQIRFFANNVMYTGGLINVAAKLDIWSVVSFIAILFASIKYIGIYSVPIAGILSSVIFSTINLIRIQSLMNCDMSKVIKNTIVLLCVAITFCILHYLLKECINGMIFQFFYFCVFTSFYFGVIYVMFREELKGMTNTIKHN